MRLYRFSLLLVVLLIATSISGNCAGVKYKATGTYVDASGGQHAWSIDDKHTLIWEGEPYVPLGAVLEYNSLGDTQDNYQADVKALEAMKSKGIYDIIIKSTGPITACDPVMLQKIVSYLDSNGYSYGIEMNDGAKDSLKGYIVAPNVYKLDGPSVNTTVVCDWPGIDSAIYVVLKKYDNSVKTIGGAIVKDGKVTVRLSEPLVGGEILFVYPHKTFKSAADGGAGDIWTGFGEYRDRTIAFFKNIKFGRGMRFFLEPFTSKMDFSGDMSGFLPDSPGFRLGFEAYLTKKYIHEGQVSTAWGVSEPLTSVEQATRMTPLWMRDRGAPFLYDVTTAKTCSIDPSSAQTWRDIMDYRDLSAQSFMNTIADTLKKNVADVPVVFKCASYNRIYATPYGIGGFDGLSAQALGPVDETVTSAVGPAYALAEECGKSMWFVASAIRASADCKPVPATAGKSSLADSIAGLREVGCKGFFFDCLQALPDNAREGFDRKAVADFKPQAFFYPTAPATGAYIKRLGPGIWWLPTLRMGKTSYIGDGVAAYTILGEDRTYVWSGAGSRTLTFKTPATGMPAVEFPAGVKLGAAKSLGSKNARKAGGGFTVPLTTAPTVLKGADIDMLFPMETANGEITRLTEMIPEADKLGLEGVKQAKAILERAKTVLDNGQFFVAFGMSQAGIQELMKPVGMDVWLEGEQPTSGNFGGAAATPGASGGLAQVLDTADDSPLAPYAANYRFEASSNSSYEIWLAGTPPSEGSPISYCADDGDWIPVSAAGKQEAYAPGLAWYKIGSMNTYPGLRSLKFKVTGRRSGDSKYYFAIDAIVLSPKGFKPDGVNRPF